MTYLFFQPPLPSFNPDINTPEIERDEVQTAAVDVESDSAPSAQRVYRRDIIEVPATTEGRGSRKRRGKHPTTLYECDCGEIISGSDVERGEGLVECNKAGCETQWVSPGPDLQY